MAPAKMAALKTTTFRIRMNHPPKGPERVLVLAVAEPPLESIQAGETIFTLIERAAGEQGFARPSGSVSH
jgi:hypothetical protein